MSKLRPGVRERSLKAVGEAKTASKNEGGTKARHRSIVDNRLNQKLAKQARSKTLNTELYQNQIAWHTGGHRI